MTEPTIFTPDTPPIVAPLVIPTAPVIPQEMIELVGVGKKYATVDDALKSVPHAQKHITTLEAELLAAKTELEKRRTAADLLEEMKAGFSSTTIPVATGTITPENITQIVEQALQQKEDNKTSTANVSTVTAAFIAKYGDKAEEFYNNLALESGLSVQTMNKLAATSPTAVLKLAGFTKAPLEPVGKLKSSINTEGVKPASDVNTSAKVQGASTKDLVTAWRNAAPKAA